MTGVGVMEGPDDVRERLKLPVQRRVKKLIRLRRRLRLWGVAGVLSAITAAAPPTLYLLTGIHPAVNDANVFDFSRAWVTPLVMIGAGLFGTLLFYRQYRKDKDKYDRIRSGAVELIRAADPICDCRWIPCDCKDNLVREMKERHDINLSY